MTFTLEGEPVRRTGGLFITALQRAAEDWRIAAWAWAKGQSAM